MGESGQPPARPKVFISYAHADKKWLDQLLPHLGLLEKQGQLELWHDKKIDGGDTWFFKIEAAMSRADVAVCLISPHYLSSDFITREEIPYLLQRCERDGMLLVPVLVRPCLWKAVDWLKAIQMLPGEGESIADDYKDREDRAWLMVADLIFKKINDPMFTVARVPPGWPALPDECVYLERLPRTGTEVFGRQEELQLLDDSWGSETTSILGFVAWGGVGKSALVNKWIAGMEADNFRGAERVYAWSFYSQGTKQRVTSADMFIDQALRWFGDKEMADSARSPWDKGRRLAELIQEKKTLLILDGMEPLQSGFQHDRGQVNDPALAVLLKQLARKNPGLCVITTREHLAGLEVYGNVIRQKNLEQISDEAGRALLRVGGIRGTDAELERVTREFGNHALAVGLLVPYLAETGREAAQVADIGDLEGIPDEEGRHPRRVMEAWVRRFGPGPEMDVLHLMGLFDRPAGEPEIMALREGEPISGLTDYIHGLSDDDWGRVISRLRKAGLIAPVSHHEPIGLDAHPLVREHFGQQLQADDEDAWRQGHLRLGLYYNNLPEKAFPDTLEEMMHLFQAVTHGCLAGLHQEVLDYVYWDRILKEESHYSWRKLGTFGADLAALAGFFDPPWRKVVSELPDQDKAFVLAQAGHYLRALGRLVEALGLAKAALDISIPIEQGNNSAITANNISELSLSLGRIESAREYSTLSVKLADDSGDLSQRFCRRTTLAASLFQAGRLTEAKALFFKAEQMQIKVEPYRPFLYSLRGFQYCRLLLDQGKHDEAQQRAEKTLGWRTRAKILLDIGLDHVTLGRSHLLAAVDKGSNDFGQARNHQDQAVDGLRRAGYRDQLPNGLLARAELLQFTGEFNLAIQDLDEAWEIAKPSGMRLFECDIHLECARLLMAMYQAGATLPDLYPDSPLALFEPSNDILAEAGQHIQAAQQLIDDTGYHRRDAEVPLETARLLFLQGDTRSARTKLEEAKKIIDDMGCHRWDIDVRQLEAEFNK